MKLWQINNGETLIWANDMIEAHSTFTELYEKAGVVKVKEVDLDEIVYLVGYKKEHEDDTNNNEWTLEPKGRRILRTLTVRKLAKQFNDV
jgi:hypothetical protein